MYTFRSLRLKIRISELATLLRRRVEWDTMCNNPAKTNRHPYDENSEMTIFVKAWKRNYQFTDYECPKGQIHQPLN